MSGRAGGILAALVIVAAALSLATPGPSARAIDPTLDAALAVIAQRTAQAQQVLEAERASRRQAEANATATGYAIQATAQANAATATAVSIQAARQFADTQATAQANAVTATAVSIQAARQSADAQATTQAKTAQTTATALSDQVAANRLAWQSDQNERLARLWGIGFVVGGTLAVLGLAADLLALENKRRAESHASRLDSARGIDSVEPAEPAPPTIVIDDPDAQEKWQAILEVNS